MFFKYFHEELCVYKVGNRNFLKGTLENNINLKKITNIYPKSLWYFLMAQKKSGLEKFVRDLLKDSEILGENLIAPEFDFGFICLYPPGPKTHKISLYKPKNGNSLIMVIRFQISENRISKLRDNQGFEVFNEIKKFLLMKEMFFKIDLQKFIIEIYEQIYLENLPSEDIIPKEILFEGFQKVFYGYLYSNILVDEYSSIFL